MTLYTSTTTSDVSTLDMTGLLEHVRSGRARRYVGRRRNPDPHPLLVALVAVGGLLLVITFWGLVAVGVLAAWF